LKVRSTAFAILALLYFSPCTRASVLQDFRIGVTPGHTRIVFELDDAADFQVGYDDTSLTVIINQLEISESTRQKLKAIKGGRISTGYFKIENGRTVFQFEIIKPFSVRYFTLTDPDRLVIDLSAPKESSITIPYRYGYVSDVAKPALTDFRLGATTERTRVVFELDRRVPFQFIREGPVLTVSFNPLIVTGEISSRLSKASGGFIRDVSFIENGSTSDFQLRIIELYNLNCFSLTEPNRLVFDIYPKEQVLQKNITEVKVISSVDILKSDSKLRQVFDGADRYAQPKRRAIENTELIEQMKPPSTNDSAGNFGFSIHPIGGYSFGFTEYGLQTIVSDPNSPTGKAKVRSELVFPLDAPLAGLSLKIIPAKILSNRWVFEADFMMHVTESPSSMTNKDWIDDLQITYTETTPKSKMSLLSTEVGYQIYRGGRSSLILFGDLTYEYIKQDLIGYEGWSYNFISDQPEPISGSEEIIDYELTYISPQLGLALEISLSRYAALEAESSAGLVFAEDKDDHLLRGKLSEADATGIGLYSGLKFKWLPNLGVKQHFSVELFGQFRYFNAKGNQTQRWYAAEPGVSAGTVIEGIPHEFISYQYLVGLRFGIML